INVKPGRLRRSLCSVMEIFQKKAEWTPTDPLRQFSQKWANSDSGCLAGAPPEKPLNPPTAEMDSNGPRAAEQTRFAHSARVIRAVQIGRQTNTRDRIQPDGQRNRIGNGSTLN